MWAWYNEHDPKIAAWLRELIAERLIADGEVDTRSILDVRPDDLRGFAQYHFFAGIGGWSYALRLAGWSDDRAVWTGSCPCQPFSSAGAQVGGDDPRHLWPAWFRLIRECRPAVVFGEQVEAAIAHGWLDLVCDDLEREGYACGAVGLPAASVGAPHIRQRVWFVAESNGAESSHEGLQRSGRLLQPAEDSPTSLMADTERGTTKRRRHDLGAATGGTQSATQERQRLRDDAGDGRNALAVADTESGDGGLLLQQRGSRQAGIEPGRRSEVEQLGDADEPRSQGRHGRELPERARERAPWAASDLVWLPCRDGKARATQPGLQPLAHGVRNRILALRGAGNSIVPQVAAEVIAAYLEIVGQRAAAVAADPPSESGAGRTRRL